MLQPGRWSTVIAAVALFSAACATGGPTTTTPTQPTVASPTPAPATATVAAGATRPATGTTPAASPAATPGGAAAAGDPAKGLAAYQKAACVGCHGDKGQGNVFPGAATLAGWSRPCGDILKQVRTPKDPSKGMPPFGAAQVSDQDVNDLCAWVKSLGTGSSSTGPAASPTTAPAASAAPASPTTAPAASAAPASPTTAPAASAAPAGDPAKGLAAYQKAACMACHGDKGQGNLFPGAAKLAAWSRPCGDILKQVRTPKDPSKGMPPFAAAQVSDQDVDDICAWVKTLQ